MGDQAIMSSAFGCLHMVFLEFSAGFKHSHRIPDREQFAVVLKGALKVTADDGNGAVVEPGGVLRIPEAEVSEHALEVVGTESVTLMVLLR